MKLIITKTFYKKLDKIKSVSLESIENLVSKIPDTNLVFEIDSFDNSIIFKWYLNSKKVRIVILFEKIENNYLPVSLLKKESKNWYNITKDNYIDFCLTDINKTIEDYNNGFYQEIDL